MESYKVFNWLKITKYCFIFPLRTGIKTHALINFVASIIIINHLSSNVIEQHQCIGYHKITDVLKCSERGEISKEISNMLKNKEIDFLPYHVSKNIISSQACLAFISTLLIWFKEKPILTLLWASCKVLVGATELLYLPAWSSELISLTFRTSINPAWFTATFLLCNGYAILVALGYYSEIVGDTTASYRVTKKNISSTIEEIPLPPALPDF